MCRNIRTLHHFEPPATEDEVRASALQYVRKLSGMAKPSRANEHVFQRAVDEITHITMHLFEDLEVHGPPRNRDDEKLKAQVRGQKRDAAMRAKVLKSLQT